jgi:hypothetical protein
MKRLKLNRPRKILRLSKLRMQQSQLQQPRKQLRRQRLRDNSQWLPTMKLKHKELLQPVKEQYLLLLKQQRSFRMIRMQQRELKEKLPTLLSKLLMKKLGKIKKQKLRQKQLHSWLSMKNLNKKDLLLLR